MALLRLKGIAKAYGDCVSLAGVDATFHPGELHAVVGENGAGKTTLLKIASGVVEQDRGQVFVDDHELTHRSPSEARHWGIGMVQQHFSIVGSLTVRENIILGDEATLLGVVKRKVVEQRISKAMSELDFQLPLDQIAATLSLGEKQKLEIVRLLYRNAQILILDEPTAVLPPSEVERLYAILLRLRDARRTVIVVTHRVDEVVKYANAVTILRHGMRKETWSVRRGDEATQKRDIANAMMGGAATQETLRAAETGLGGPALTFRDVRLGPTFDGLSLEIRSGEAVGIAGIEGNGQRELVDVITGRMKPSRGVYWAKGSSVAIVHEDRQTEGLVLSASVSDNLLLGEESEFAELGILDEDAWQKEASKRLTESGAVPADGTLAASSLSGGNQQKLCVARALAQVKEGASAFVLVHPTRGVDFAAQEAIHRRILTERDKRIATLVISHDLDELRTLCNRIAVLRGGKIVATLSPSASDQEIGQAMVGASS